MKNMKTGEKDGEKPSEQGAGGQAEGKIDKEVEMELMKDGHKVPNYNANAESVSDKQKLVHEEKDFVNEEDKKYQSNIPMTSCNIINSILGSGIIGIPYAIKECGLGLGIILLVVVGLISDYTLDLLIVSGNMSGTRSYQQMMAAAFGKAGFYVITWVQFTSPFIAMVSYNVIIGDVIIKLIRRIASDTVKYSILANRQFIIFAFTMIVMLPLSLYRNIARLTKWSALSSLLVLALAVFLIIRLVTFARQVPTNPSLWGFANSVDAIKGISIMCVAYLCQHNCFLVYDSMVNPTRERFCVVIHMGVLFSMTIMIAFGVIGFATFGKYTQGDLMENYCYTDDLANVARGLFALSVALTFPLECFVCREVVEILLFHNKDEPQPLWRHLVETVIVVFSVTGISMLTDCLGIVLVFNGALTAIPLTFILPTIAYLKLQCASETFWKPWNIVPVLVFIMGVAFCLIGLTLAIIEAVKGVRCSHGVEMFYCNTKHLNATFHGNTSSLHLASNRTT